MDRLEAAKYIKDHCLGSEVYRDGTTWNDAMVTAVEVLEGKDTNVPTNSALDHIHNVVAENERKRGYEQAKAEYDHKLTEIKSRIKDHYYNKGYEQGKADAKAEAIPLAWIKGYIVTCDLFDLRVIVPASKVIKTMVKIWEQENPGAKKGEQHETD
jgi:hypothetical protein